MSDFDSRWQHIGRLREVYLLKVEQPPPSIGVP